MHLSQVLSFWRGGMASHGVLLGGIVGIFLFSRLRHRSFLDIADEVVIPAAFLLALGRIGNFINGEIYGSVTNVWWAVRFPDADGFRHPVTLYESLKNFMIIPILICARKRDCCSRGTLLAHFIFWYGFLRIFADYFRKYGTEFLGIGTGQYFNIFMALGGIGLYIWASRTRPVSDLSKLQASQLDDGKTKKSDSTSTGANLFSAIVKRVVFISILFFSLTIPSSWTQGVLKQYRSRQISQRTLVHRDFYLIRENALLQVLDIDFGDASQEKLEKIHE